MALKGTVSRTLSFTSMIGDFTVVYMSATIPDEGTSNRSVNIADREVYEANKSECRADMQEFNRLVDAMEDEAQ